jgi:hypothetical protein
MLNQGSAKWASECLYENQNKYYKEKEAAYYTGKFDGAIFPDFPSLKEWRGPFPPSSDQLLDLAEKAVISKNTMSEVCDDERHKREIQGVGCKKSCVIDHTFSALSNYQSSLGAKAIFCQGVPPVMLVASTAINQASHVVEQCAHCWNYIPFIISSDTFPKLFNFFKLIYGSAIVGQLGLFHFVQCIMKCMQNDHPDYWQALSRFQDCLYHYNGKDESMIIQALADGTMNGKKHSEDKMVQLKDSSKWSRRYYAFMRKVSTPFEVSRIEMQKCRNMSKVEDGNGCLYNGHSVFLPGARDAFWNGLETLKYVPDVFPNMYKQCPFPSMDCANG